MANMKYLNQYEKENIRQIRLKINRKTEPQLLAWVEKQENIQGYIKRLIEEDMKKGEKKMKTISINNGRSETTAEEAIKAVGFDTIVNMMDDETREKVHAEGYDTDVEFLERYLEIAPYGIVIG